MSAVVHSSMPHPPAIVDEIGKRRRQVYGLLSAQLTFTVAVGSLCMFTPFIRNVMVGWATSMSWWIMFVPLSLTFGSLLVLEFEETYRRRYPTNIGLLFIFTLGISLQVGFICSIYYSAGLGQLILQAAWITYVTFLGLTAYVLYSGKDFSWMDGIAATLLWGLVVFGFVAIWFQVPALTLLYGVIGAVTFCGLILFDTWRLEQTGYDDYILATIELYLDIINLFLHILNILKELKDSHDEDEDHEE